MPCVYFFEKTLRFYAMGDSIFYALSLGKGRHGFNVNTTLVNNLYELLSNCLFSSLNSVKN